MNKNIKLGLILAVLSLSLEAWGSEALAQAQSTLNSDLVTANSYLNTLIMNGNASSVLRQSNWYTQDLPNLQNALKSGNFTNAISLYNQQKNDFDSISESLDNSSHPNTMMILDEMSDYQSPLLSILTKLESDAAAVQAAKQDTNPVVSPLTTAINNAVSVIQSNLNLSNYKSGFLYNMNAIQGWHNYYVAAQNSITSNTLILALNNNNTPAQIQTAASNPSAIPNNIANSTTINDLIYQLQQLQSGLSTNITADNPVYNNAQTAITSINDILNALNAYKSAAGLS